MLIISWADHASQLRYQFTAVAKDPIMQHARLPLYVSAMATTGLQQCSSHAQDRKLAQEGLWAHETEVPEVGGLLIARPEGPELVGDARYWQLVIFLLEVGPRGARGVILNRPASAKVNTPVFMWHRDSVRVALYVMDCSDVPGALIDAPADDASTSSSSALVVVSMHSIHLFIHRFISTVN